MLTTSDYIHTFTHLCEITHLFNRSIEYKPQVTYLVMLNLTKMYLERKSNSYPRNAEGVSSLDITELWWDFWVWWFLFPLPPPFPLASVCL